MIGSADAKSLASFYEKVFGKKADWSMEEWSGFKIGETFITIGPHSEVGKKSKEPQRIMINFYTKDVEKEFERIKKETGAKVIKEPYHPEEEKEGMIATLEDPDGNYFQLATPWGEEK
ncbi:MAG TPA: VOC family protein [Candidatus Saccharimonadales bacterium]|nr:VOC family protein [Candidatus Saccharimonadales bacterium]